MDRKVISITGGVGSGKSEVMKVLKEDYNAEVIIADQVAHQLMEPMEEGYKQIVALFGSKCLLEDKTVDRKKLAGLLFSDKDMVKKVNAIIHPMAWNAIECRIKASTKNLIIVEAALYDEKHNAMFDEIWYIYATVDNRLKRLKENRGYTEKKCLEIMENQAAEAEFRALADHVIDNNGSVMEIRAQLKEILKEE